MLNKDMSKIEIEKELEGKGDFVKIDHLNRLLKKHDLPIEKRKFAFLKLAEIYDSKGMFVDAAKSYDGAAVASVLFKEKIVLYVKSAEEFIKAGQFQRADEAMKKSFVQANSSQREEIYISLKQFYKDLATKYEKENRRNNAIKLYEKVLTMRIADNERQEMKDKLLGLYEKTGRLREYFSLKSGKW